MSGKPELGTASVLEKGQVQWETAGVMDTGGLRRQSGGGLRGKEAGTERARPRRSPEPGGHSGQCSGVPAMPFLLLEEQGDQKPGGDETSYCISPILSYFLLLLFFSFPLSL